MVKSNINYFGIIGCAVIYSVTCFASAFIGFVNPWCWIVVFPALAAIFGAPSYLWAASRWQRFGVATLFSVVLAALLLLMGEINLTQTALMVVTGVASDTVRQLHENNSKRSAFFSYPVLSLSVIAWLIKLWTNSEWYYQGAADEIGVDYAEGLKTLSSVWVLFMVIALPLVVAYIAISSFSRLRIGHDRLS